MGRMAKHKAAKVASKRRKKSASASASVTTSAASASASTASTTFSSSRRPLAATLADSVALANASVAAASPMSATGSTSGASTPSSGKECEQCGNPTTLEGVAAARAWANAGKKQQASAGGCQICDFVLYRKSQRPCVHCERVSCEHFCEWCGNGYHTKCARVRDEKVNAPNGFCCRKCEAEQADDEESAAEKSDDEEEMGSRCGSCRLPFNATAKEDESGFKVNQSVLVENDEVLYNAVITDVDMRDERIKIHFIRWSKSFDNWYAMDDEHINESLACDCCNQWFHIGCLPPIKSSGRFKDTTYVCPACIDDAKHFHNGTRPKAKTSGGHAKVSSRKSSMSEDTAPVIASSKRKSSKPIITSDDEQDVKRPNSKKKRKLSVSSDSPVKKKPELSRASSRSKSPDPPLALTEKANASTDDKDNEADGDNEDDELVPDSEASTEKGASPAPGSPSAPVPETRENERAAAASPSTSSTKQSSSNGKTPTPSDSEATEQSKENESRSSGDKQSQPANNFHRRKPSSHSVSALLNSPSPNEKPATPPIHANVGSLSMLDESRRNLTSSFGVLVKVERHSQQLPPLPSSLVSRSSASSASSKATAKIEPYQQSSSNWPPRPAQPKSSSANGSGGSGRGPLSAFDILREVATQSIGGELDAAPVGPTVKPKKEPRARSSAAKAKNAKADKAAAEKAAAAAKAGGSGASASSGTPTSEQDRQFLQSKERIHLNAFVDLHFNIRKEMYLKFCMLEEQGLLDRDTAQLLRSLIYPTSDKFQDLKFVYLVNKDLSPLYLTRRLLEVVPTSMGGTGGALPAPRVDTSTGARSVAASSPASAASHAPSGASLPAMVPPGLTIPSFSEIIAPEKKRPEVIAKELAPPLPIPLTQAATASSTPTTVAAVVTPTTTAASVAK